MLIRNLTAMIHQNAVDHGWWEEEISLYEIVALIHSEWSEALEEARAGRPNVYKLYIGERDEGEPRYITPDNPDYEALHAKPEGIAVELIDGVIRILDAFGKYEIELEDSETGAPSTLESLWGKNCIDENSMTEHVPELIAILHGYTSKIIMDDESNPIDLFATMSLALTWIYRQGIDPLKLLLEKHQYNVTRPYKHGKIF